MGLLHGPASYPGREPNAWEGHQEPVDPYRTQPVDVRIAQSDECQPDAAADRHQDGKPGAEDAAGEVERS